MRNAWWSKFALLPLILLGGSLTAIFFWSPQHASAAVGVNQQLSFQGKLVNKTGGTNISDGTYNMEFKIYQDGTGVTGGGSTLKWTEDYLVGGSIGGVTLTNGTFQVNLGGSAAPFTGVDWNQDTLWLSIQIGNIANCTISTTFQTNCGGDGEMSPYVRLTSTPYALNSDKLDGLDSAAFGQLATTNTWSAANKILATSQNALQIQNASYNVFNVDTVNNQVKVLDGALAQNALNLSSGAIASSTALNISSGGNINLSPVAGSDVVFNQGAGSNLQITANAVPTVDQVAISNAGQGVTTTGINGLSINYVGGAAAVESAGERIDLTPGTTSGGTWNGLRIVAGNTGAASGVSENGLKLEGPTSSGSGTETAVKITTGWDIGLDIQSGGIQLADSSTPTTPTNGNLKIYSTSIAGRSMLAGIGSSGVEYAYQPSLFQQNVVLITPGSGTSTSTFSSTGGALATSGTLSTTTAITEAQGAMATITSASTASSGAGVSTANSQYYRGSGGSNADGFFFFARISLPDALTNYTSSTTGARVFVGLSSLNIVGTSGTMASSDNPSGDYAGFQYSPVRDAGLNNFSFITKNNTTQHTTFSGVPVAVNKTFDFYIYCKPGDSTIHWRVDNLTDGTTPVEGSETNNLPTATTAMKAGIAVGPMNAGGHNLRMQRVYVESDR